MARAGSFFGENDTRSFHFTRRGMRDAGHTPCGVRQPSGALRRRRSRGGDARPQYVPPYSRRVAPLLPKRQRAGALHMTRTAAILLTASGALAAGAIATFLITGSDQDSALPFSGATEKKSTAWSSPEPHKTPVSHPYQDTRTPIGSDAPTHSTTRSHPYPDTRTPIGSAAPTHSTTRSHPYPDTRTPIGSAAPTHGTTRSHPYPDTRAPIGSAAPTHTQHVSSAYSAQLRPMPRTDKLHQHQPQPAPAGTVTTTPAAKKHTGAGLAQPPRAEALHTTTPAAQPPNANDQQTQATTSPAPAEQSAALSTLATQPRTHKWPSPFTPEEERFRQQMGVQAYINLQHEWATGQKRQ